MRPVTYSLLPEFGRVQSSDMNMGGGPVSQYALRRSSPMPNNSGLHRVGVQDRWRQGTLGRIRSSKCNGNVDLLLRIDTPIEGFI